MVSSVWDAYAPHDQGTPAPAPAYHPQQRLSVAGFHQRAHSVGDHYSYPSADRSQDRQQIRPMSAQGQRFVDSQPRVASHGPTPPTRGSSQRVPPSAFPPGPAAYPHQTVTSEYRTPSAAEFYADVWQPRPAPGYSNVPSVNGYHAPEQPVYVTEPAPAAGRPLNPMSPPSYHSSPVPAFGYAHTPPPPPHPPASPHPYQEYQQPPPQSPASPHPYQGYQQPVQSQQLPPVSPYPPHSPASPHSYQGYQQSPQPPASPNPYQGYQQPPHPPASPNPYQGYQQPVQPQQLRPVSPQPPHSPASPHPHQVYPQPAQSQPFSPVSPHPANGFHMSYQDPYPPHPPQEQYAAYRRPSPAPSFQHQSNASGQSFIAELPADDIPLTKAKSAHQQAVELPTEIYRAPPSAAVRSQEPSRPLSGYVNDVEGTSVDQLSKRFDKVGFEGDESYPGSFEPIAPLRIRKSTKKAGDSTSNSPGRPAGVPEVANESAHGEQSDLAQLIHQELWSGSR